MSGKQFTSIKTLHTEVYTLHATENRLKIPSKCRLSWAVYKAFPPTSSHLTPSTSFRVNPGKPYGSQIGFIKSSGIAEEARTTKRLSNGCFSTCSFSEVTTLGVHHTDRFKCHQRDIPSRSKTGIIPRSGVCKSARWGEDECNEDQGEKLASAPGQGTPPQTGFPTEQRRFGKRQINTAAPVPERSARSGNPLE